MIPSEYPLNIMTNKNFKRKMSKSLHCIKHEKKTLVNLGFHLALFYEAFILMKLSPSSFNYINIFWQFYKLQIKVSNYQKHEKTLGGYQTSF